MPRGPQGQWRPAADNECAALVCRIATGESPEVYEPPERTEEQKAAASRRASAGGRARAKRKSLSPERRWEIAASGAAAREEARS